MAATPSIRSVKTLPRRGGTVQWSNRYHFSGGTPADLAHWTTLADNVTDQEQICFGPDVEIVEVLCYAAGSDLPIHSITYAKTGTMVVTGTEIPPSDCTLFTRFSTDQRTVKNHPIYLFNYFHGARMDSTAQRDTPSSLQRTRLQELADGWVSGYSDGAVTYHRAGPNGAVALDAIVATWIGHRDFPT